MDLEGRALADLAVDVDASSAERRLVHADTRVGDRYHDMQAGCDSQVPLRIRRVEVHVAGFQRELASRRHGVAGIGGETQDHLLDLPVVGPGKTKIGRQGKHEVDALADDSTEHRLHVGEDLVEIHRHQLQNLLSAERQELLRQPSCAPAPWTSTQAPLLPEGSVM